MAGTHGANVAAGATNGSGSTSFGEVGGSTVRTATEPNAAGGGGGGQVTGIGGVAVESNTLRGGSSGFGGLGQGGSGTTTSVVTSGGMTAQSLTVLGGANNVAGNSTTVPSAGSAGTTSTRRAKPVGNINLRGAPRSDFGQYWDQITIRNEGMWGSVEVSRDRFNFTGLDAVYDYAVAKGIPFREHVFLAGIQQPPWMAALSASEQLEEIDEWMTAFCARYPLTDQIEVVYEPPPHTPGYVDALGGAGATGFDWIVKAFQMARQRCPGAKLMLTDYNALRQDHKQFLTMATVLRDSGYLDALGSESHDQETQTLAELTENLQNLAQLGVPIYITEYDLDIADDVEHSRVFQEQMGLFLKSPAVHGITLWGYIEKETWKPDTYLLRTDGTARPALTWLMDDLGRTGVN